jgi:DNA-binding response OmpR family regulator
VSHSAGRVTQSGTTGAGSALPPNAQTRRPIFFTMASAGASFEDGPLHIDFDHRAVTLNAQPVELASQEYNLLAGLVRNPGAVLPYQRIVELDHRMGWGHVAAKYACVRLHRKLGLDDDELWGGVIQHVPGIGYRYRTGRFPSCP